MSAIEVVVILFGLVGGSIVAFACIGFVRRQALKQSDTEKEDNGSP